MENLNLIFLIFTTLTFLTLFIVWSSKDWVNVLIKVWFFVLAFSGSFLIFVQLTQYVKH